LRSVYAILLLVGLVAAACGGGDDDNGDGGSVTNVEDAETCAQVMDVAMLQIQELLDAASTMDLTELSSSQEFTDFQTEFEALDAKSQELNCSDEEMEQLYNERIDDLTAEGPVAEELLEQLRSEGFSQ
jgi:hypothetical protein